MAKISMIQKERRRERIVCKYSSKRAELKKRMLDQSLSDEEREKARCKFRSLPRDSSPVRLHSRCAVTGRPHGYFRKFGLCRNILREAAMRGDIPGLRKASW